MKPASEDIKNYKIMRGYLKKKSPTILKGFQKRFFMIVDDGNILAWCDDESVSAKPKGSIDIREIEGIKRVSSTDFEIKYGGRSFVLRAESESDRERWIKGLNALQNYLFKQEEIYPSIRNRTMTNNKRLSGRDDFWREMDADTMKKIQMEKEKRIIEETYLLRKIENDEILKKKGLKSYLSDINKEVLDKRIIMGYLYKKGQKQNTKFQKRWFILISSKILFSNEEPDENIIKESQLPPKMELDTIYYYQYEFEGDSSGPKGSIPMIKCLDVLKDDKQNSGRDNSFKLNMGDRIFVISAETELDRDKWIDALRNSVRNVKERNAKGQGGGQLVLKKNIDKAIDIYDQSGLSDEERKNKLQKYMDETAQNLTNSLLTSSQKLEDIKDLKIFLKGLDLFNQELIDVIIACYAKDPKRTDIIKEYIDYFYEKICIFLKNYWDRFNTQIDNFSILNLVIWVKQFYKSVSPYIEDERFPKGIHTLLNIYINRLIDNVENMVQGIVELEKKSQPQANENGCLVSTAPIDLFKLINEGFEMAIKKMDSEEMGIKLAFFGKRVLLIYQDLMDNLIDEEDLGIEHLIAISNNTVAFSTYTKDYASRLKSEFKLNDEQIDSFFDTSKILKHFGAIGTNSKDKLLMILFKNVTCYFHCYFLDLDLEALLKELIEKYKETFSLLHNNFYRKIWKSFLDNVIVNYFQSLIFSCGKGKDIHREKFVEKLETDLQFLENEFSGLIFVSLLEKSLKPFKYITFFLRTNLFFCLEYFCVKLRENFGPAFNLNTVRLVLNIRKDLEKEYIKQVFLNIQDCFEDVEKKEKEQEDQKEQEDAKAKMHELFFNLIHDKVEEEAKKENNDLRKISLETKEEIKKPQEQERRSILKKASVIEINLHDLDIHQISNQSEKAASPSMQRKKTEVSKKIFTGEGYLLKKPPKAYKKFWEKRFFRLRNGVLYWYKNENATEAQNKIILCEASDCFTYKENNKFKILINGVYYKFSAPTPKEGEQWVQAINKAINREEEKNQEENEEKYKEVFVVTQEKKTPLFTDYDMQIRIENNKNLLSKRNEKEKQKQMEVISKKIKTEENVSTLPPLKIDIDVNVKPHVISDIMVQKKTSESKNPSRTTNSGPSKSEQEALKKRETIKLE